MVERSTSVDRSTSTASAQEVVEFNPDFDEIAAAVASANVANVLRPPELQFEDVSRLGAPRFEAQAIASMDMLKANSQESTLNSLSALLMQQGPDIEKTGSDDAKLGLRVLDEFLGQSAVLLAIRKGGAE